MGSRYVREAVEDWLAFLSVERQLATNTAEAYARDISQFLAFLAGHLNHLPDMKQLLVLQARDVRAFLAARRGEGVGSRSLARSLSALRMFYRFLERRGYGKNDAIRAAPPHGSVTGTFRRTTTGMGIVRPAAVEGWPAPEIRIHEEDCRDASTGDTVLVKVTQRPFGLIHTQGKA